MYSSLNNVFATLSNIAYYCETNHCNSRIKQLINAHLTNSDTEDPECNIALCIEKVFSDHFSNSFEAASHQLCNNIKDLSSKVKNLQTENNSLQSEINRTSDRINETIQHVDNPSTGITASVLCAISEEKEREKRRLNLIFHNLQEPINDNGLARKEADIQRAPSIIKDYLGISATINNAVRLGKRGEKPRLLKITIDTPQTKAAILCKRTTLRDEKNPEDVRNIYITPDLTLKERDANKKLRLELTKKNKSGREYMIRNGKIV